MRTTLTIDPDVAAEIDRLRHDRGVSLKALVNELLRVGLNVRQGRTPQRGGPYTRVLKAGQPLIPIDNISEALAIAEGEDYK